MATSTDIVGTEVCDRDGVMRGRVHRPLNSTLADGSRLYLIHWENGSVSTVWDFELKENRRSEVSPIGGWFVNKFGIHQVCRQKE